MASILDDWEIEVPDTRPNDKIRVVDADTVVVNPGQANAQKIRIGGVNAREVARVDDPKKGFKAGDFGGEAQSAAAAKLIRAGGYTQPVTTGDKTYNREVGDIINPETGASYRSALIESRIAPTTSLGSTDADRSQGYMADFYRARRRSDGKQTMADMLLDDLVKKDKERLGGAAFIPKIHADSASAYGASLDSKDQSRYFTGPAFIKQDENYKGEALNPFSTGLDSGYESVKLGLAGAAQLTHLAKDWGRALETASEENQADMPRLKRMFDQDGNFDLNKMGDYTDWMAGMLGSSLPSMAVTIGGMAAIGLTGGASMALPALMYAGQTFSEQEDGEKNELRALASGVGQAAADSIGLALSGGLTAARLLTGGGAKEASKQLAKQQGITLKAAENKVFQAINKQWGDVTKAMSSKIDDMGTAGKGLVVGGKTVAGATAESGTEVIQESIGMWGQSGKAPDMNDAQTRERLIEAAAGGFALGGGLNVATQIASKGLTKPTGQEKTESADSRIRREHIADDIGRIASVSEITSKVEDTTETLDSLASIRQAKEDAFVPVLGKLGDAFKRGGIKEAWAGWNSSMFNHQNEYKGMNTSALMTMFGFAKHLNGGDIETNRNIAQGAILSKVATPQEMTARFGMDTKKISNLMANASVNEAFSDLHSAMLRDPSKSLEDLAADISFDKRLGSNAQYAEPLLKTYRELQGVADQYSRLTGHKTTVQDIINNRPVNKKEVKARRGEFIGLLQKELGLDHKAATNAANRILNQPVTETVQDAFDLDSLFDTAKIDFKPEEVQKKLNEKIDVFAPFLTNNFSGNIGSLAARGANAHIQKAYLSKVPALLSAAMKGGEMDAEQASFIAQQVKHYQQKRTGEYQPMPEWAKSTLSGISFLSLVAALPLAAVSSTVEFAQVRRSLNAGQTGAAFKKMASATASELAHLYGEAGSAITGNPGIMTEDRRQLIKAGFSEQQLDRQDVFRGNFDVATAKFFKITGLESVTAIARSTRLSAANDAIGGWYSQYLADPTSEQGRDAREHLIRVGMDPDFDFESDDLTQADYDRMLEIGRHNFVTEAVVQPNSLNRPKFYSDPYYRIFTAMQGYVGTFTAQVLPRLFKDLADRGSQGQRDAIATVALMAALSYLAFQTKEAIKLGLVPDEKEEEWLKKQRKFRSENEAIWDQMGLIGTGQRFYNLAKDLGQAKTVGAALERATVGEAPPVKYTVDVIKAAFDDASGKEKQQQVSKILPAGSVLKNYFQ